MTGPDGDAPLRIDDRLLAALARELEAADPVPWGAAGLDREAVFALIASQVAELFRGHEARGDSRDRQLLIALSACVKLSVENFVLHRRLIEALGRRS